MASREEGGETFFLFSEEFLQFRLSDSEEEEEQQAKEEEIKKKEIEAPEQKE